MLEQDIAGSSLVCITITILSLVTLAAIKAFAYLWEDRKYVECVGDYKMHGFLQGPFFPKVDNTISFPDVRWIAFYVVIYPMQERIQDFF